ncbi:SpoIIIAH-like family protein [Solibacillus cecembensis]|uniref:SpoIIIAH-like family protein n=1 Tax=Solibacillus cecembensis TaxID=459347 RepID=UPI000717216A
MKVKKRTVWFLTLFSLVAVIGVYYAVDGNKTGNMLTIFTDSALDETDILGVTPDITKTVNSESDLFQEMRLEVSNKRSQLREQLTLKTASSEYTAEEKSAAFDEMEQLINRESTEATLEMLVKSFGYDDALVRIEDEKVAVTVMSDENSKAQANEIVHLIKTEVDENVIVTVDIKPFY